MVIFVVAIPKTIPCKKLPLKAASAGTPALLDVKASVSVAVSQRIGSRRNARTAWRNLSIVSPQGDRAAKGYFLSRTEYLFRTAISLDAASGIFAPLPRICLLVQRLP